MTVVRVGRQECNVEQYVEAVVGYTNSHLVFRIVMQLTALGSGPCMLCNFRACSLNIIISSRST